MAEISAVLGMDESLRVESDSKQIKLLNVKLAKN